MSFKSDLIDYHQDIETKYWSLMTTALKKDLILVLNKLNHNNGIILSVKIIHSEDVIYSKWSHEDDVDLYYDVMHFVDDF
jgi:hypothetical protein